MKKFFSKLMQEYKVSLFEVIGVALAILLINVSLIIRGVNDDLSKERIDSQYKLIIKQGKVIEGLVDFANQQTVINGKVIDTLDMINHVCVVDYNGTEK